MINNGPAVSICHFFSAKGASLYCTAIFKTKTETFPYKIRDVQPLLKIKKGRLSYAQTCLQEVQIGEKFLKRKNFTDECKVSLCGAGNPLNYRVCRNEGPHQVNEVLHQGKSTMVWCLITREEIIGPCFLKAVYSARSI